VLVKYDSRIHRVLVLTAVEKVIVTSYLFPQGKFSLDRLKAVSGVVGKDRLVVDVR